METKPSCSINTTNAPHCIFCEMIHKKIPSTWVYEDSHIIAVNDIAPVAPQHVLIIPRQHIPTINDLQTENNQVIGHMIYIAQQIAKQRAIHQSGYRLLFNCNADGGQAVYHIHLHLVGGRRMDWPPG